MTENSGTIDHDRLFKELLQTYLKEFFEAFFPEAAQVLDLADCQFLTQEAFTGLEQDKRYVDVVATAKIRGEPGTVLVHVDSQQEPQNTFAERMFRYFLRLYEKHGKRVLPVALFTFDTIRDEPDHFALGFPFLEVVRFQFYTLQPKRLPWRDFLRGDNPAAAALLSKMGYKPEERVQVKQEFFRMLTRLQIDPERSAFLVGFFETYLRLTPQEEAELTRMIGSLKKEEAEKVIQWTTSYHEKGRMEGRTEGIVEGRAEGKAEGLVEGLIKAKREDITQFISTRFDIDPTEFAAQTAALQTPEELDRLLRRLFKAASLEEVRQILAE